MVEYNFKPLTFAPTKASDLRPPVTGSDMTYGYDHVSGELKSLLYDKKALLFVVTFRPGPDAKGDDPKCYGEMEFFLTRYKNFYVGKVTRQAPSDFAFHKLEDDLTSLGRADERLPGIGDRAGASFFCLPRGYQNQFSVSAYFKSGMFGGWSDVVIRTPKSNYYVARP